MAIVSGVHSYEKLTAPGPAKVEMKLEVVVIPVSDVDRSRNFTPNWVGDSMPTSSSIMVSESFSSRRPVRVVRCNLARKSLRPHPARHKAPTWSSLTLRPHARSWSRAVSRLAKCSTPWRRVLSSSPQARAVASADQRRITPATVLSQHLVTRMATAGCCRRSLRACRED